LLKVFLSAIFKIALKARVSRHSWFCDSP